ncbi:armadillo-type protein [Podospora didyma]|uniref:Pumilio homology domain family member 3 n=1 Tax=Podospora didyma TaxID=330526 RepID=A0AAE0KFQ7_9PEZI|nr:armadillo-type protein [Podospora didyma]
MTSNNNSYYSAPQAQIQPAIGQRGPVRSKVGPGLETSNGSFKFPHFPDEKDASGVFANVNGFPASKRPSQDPSYLNMVGGATRDPSMPSSSHSETELRGGGSAYGDFPYGTHAQNAAHSQRPSVSGHSASFSAQNNRMYNHQQMDEEELPDRLRTLSMADGSNGIANGLPSLGYGPSQPFQFNPGSQPWENGQGFAPYSKEMYSSVVGHEKRGSIVDRGSPAGSAYRVGLGSPKTFPSTPQPGADPWSRPVSRDLRSSHDTERRTNAQQFVQQQPPQFYPQYYNHSYQPFPPHVYDSYSMNYNRPSTSVGGFGPPMHAYLAGAPNVPIRPSKDQDPGKGIRSVLLEEFRSSSKSNKRYELKDIYHYIVEFSGDQHGSRFIQQKLETANSDEKEQVFREIEPNAIQLMKDVFGNYVIQKFFEHGNQVQKKILASAMKGKVHDLSTQMYACRVVQKALEHILVEQQAQLVKELEPKILEVVKEQNGNHVVQKIIELVPRQHIGFIMDCFRGRVSELASHSYGCRVIQRVLEYGTEEDKAFIMAELHQCADMLITDQYGNYVTQHVIQHGKPEDRSKIIAIVTDQLVSHSKHKFASNVVEKCIEYGTTEERRIIRERLMADRDESNSALGLMMKDQYGNYVIQKLMSQLEGYDRETFVEEMKPQFIALKKSGTGRQIAALDRLMTTAQSSVSATKNATPSSTAPASPSLQVDVGSSVPTPNLTMETNSPSSSPPSPNAAAVDDAVERANIKLAGSDIAACAQPHVNEA